MPGDMNYFTQITMEVADDPEYLAAMKRGHVQGALIGIETVTPEGLKATNKTFNSTGQELVDKLNQVRKTGFPYIMGAFIFGIETDTQASLDYTMQFAKDWSLLKPIREDYDYWLDPNHPRILYHHPNLSEKQLLDKVEDAWRNFYGFTAVLKRSMSLGMFSDWRKALTYFVVCRGLLTRYKRYGLSADSAVQGTKRRMASWLGRAALSLMKRAPITSAGGPLGAQLKN